MYSTVRFEPLGRGARTVLEFDHSGFPASDANNLPQGWQQNLGQPMTTLRRE